MEEVMTSWGSLPRWKARALALGEIQSVVNALHGDVTIRADYDAAGAGALGDRDKPPPLAADAEEPEPAIDPDVLDAIDQKINELAGRMERLERRKAAEEALLALEDEIERMYPASNDDDDDDDMTLKPRRH
jgi:hypothetical protein